MEALERITGQSMAVGGLGGWSGDIRGSRSGVKDLKGKELGHVW